MNAAEVEQAMLALNRRDLAAVIHRGLLALDAGELNENQEEIDTVWRDELSKRIDDIHSGRVKTIPLEESFAQARATLDALRG